MPTLKGFRQYIADLEVEKSDGANRERLAIYHVATADLVAQTLLRAVLLESLPRVDLGKGRSIMFHKAHIPNSEDHLHFLVKGRKFAALNKSGSAHDQSHGVQLQQWAIDGAQKHYPDFKMPGRGLIEQLFNSDAQQVLIESAATEGDTVSKAAQLVAEVKAVEGLR